MVISPNQKHGPGLAAQRGTARRLVRARRPTHSRTSPEYTRQAHAKLIQSP
jgi:hypothetical protein